MRTLILLALAADPIPASQHETISRTMLNAMSAQIQLLKYREQADIKTLQLRVYEAQEKQFTGEWTKMLYKLQKEYHAEGCNVDANKNWVCP